MRIVVAPDSFKGTLTAVEAARSIREGWTAARPDDEVVELPLSDGGDGLLEVLEAGSGDATRRTTEVADPLGRPHQAAWLVLGDGTAVIESAQACGLELIPAASRNPMATTTYGVGQLLEAARSAGARQVLVGLGGSGTVDGGAGAVTALGYQVSIDDGNGLKVGAADLHRVRRVEPRWVGAWSAVEVELLADVGTVLLDAPASFGPQKGATPEMIDALEAAFEVWAEVVEGSFDVAGLRAVEGTGAAGGLGFGLAAAVGGRLVDGAARVLELVGFHDRVADADLVITGEGKLDASSAAGKVVGTVLRASGETPVIALVGQADEELPEELTGRLARIMEAPAPADGSEAAEALRQAAGELARERGR